MRTQFLRLALLCLLASPLRAEEENNVTSEELNFSLSLPDSLDWVIEEIPEGKENVRWKVHFSTIFVNLDDGSRGDVKLYVMPMSQHDIRQGLDKIAMRWKSNLEGFLESPHDRSDQLGKLGGQECVESVVNGIYGTGPYRRTWILTRMGKYMYFLIFDRQKKAIGDEDLDEEMQEIRDSFKFLREEKLAKHKEGKKAQKGAGGMGGEQGGNEPEVDPKLLEPEDISPKMVFWKFEATKPQGLLYEKPTSADLKRDVRAKFEINSRKGYVLIEIYAQTKSKARYTLDQMAARYEKIFNERHKKPKDPVIDTKYKKNIPLAKKALRIEFIGRRGSVVKELWIMAECSNDRQYRIRILTQRSGDKNYKKQIDDFLASFKPVKK